MRRRDNGVALKRVWIDSWQMQCCGEPFAVGGTATWTTSTAIDRNYLDAVLGTEVAASITHAEEHHAVRPAGLTTTTGTVKFIDAISCRFAVQDGVSYPMAGTVVIKPLQRADGFEPEDDEHSFVGYVVTVR